MTWIIIGILSGAVLLLSWMLWKLSVIKHANAIVHIAFIAYDEDDEVMGHSHFYYLPQSVDKEECRKEAIREWLSSMHESIPNEYRHSVRCEIESMTLVMNNREQIVLDNFEIRESAYI